MNISERKNWQINIENIAAEVAAKVGSNVVQSVFYRFNAHSLSDLDPCYYSEVFGDLMSISADVE